MSGVVTKIMSDVYISHDFEQRLVAAAEAGDISTVRKLLRKKVSTHVKDEYGKMALGVSSLAGHTEVVRILLENGADVNQRFGSNVTALHTAARNHHTETVKHLVLAGAQLDAENCSNITPDQLCSYDSTTWKMLNDAQRGITPKIQEESEVPVIPNYALPKVAIIKDKKKSGTNEKKKVGKKGRKKKGKNKKK